MDVKQKPKPRPASRLELADRQIGVLKKKLLPYDPHLLKVDIKNPFNGGYPHEFENTPFEMYEVKDLQYMTMISEGSRGIADAKGNWQDEINSRSPSVQAARSNAATPNSARESKVPLKKISIADYKNRKAGVKTTPKPGATEENRLGHSRNASGVSISTPMSRVASFEGPPEVKQNGASSNSVFTDKSTARETQRSAAQNPTTADANRKGPATNGHSESSSNSLKVKANNSNVRPPQKSSEQPRDQPRHGLPPRPQSPPRKNIDRREPTSDPRQLKRQLESSDIGSSEKRAKVENTRTPSNSQPNPSRKPETHSERKPRSPAKAPKSHASPQPKTTASKKPIATPKLEKPVHIPPLLSPLPADLENSPAPPVSKAKISESTKQPPSSTLPKSKVPFDTIVVKSKPSALPASTSSPLSTPPNSNPSTTPPFVPPRLLSPTLPAIVEEELHRLQLKSVAAAQNTVEARHEKARRPDTPGVARKTPKTSRASKAPAVPQTKDQLIVKLKYKKRKANDIARILKLEPRPTREFLRLERERVARQEMPKDEDFEEDKDIPIAVTIPKPPAAPAVTKKRPGESLESRTSEPAAKRPRVSDSIEVSKAKVPVEPTFKSPAVSAPPPSQKTLLATPKKGDAMKSVAMRKVDSSDGHARTPQTASTSTPASAEKPRLNGDSRSSVEIDSLRAIIKNFDDQALKLKRKMDEILQTKTRGFGTITESQKILGLSVGLECIVMYMQSFQAKEKMGKHRQALAWEGGIKLWEFVDNLARQFPVLNALSSHIGAVCKEELGRAYIEDLRDKQDSKFLETLAGNEMGRDRLWKQVHRSRHVLEPLDVKDTVGPWTSVAECTTYTIKVLEAYARKEKTGWRISV